MKKRFGKYQGYLDTMPEEALVFQTLLGLLARDYLKKSNSDTKILKDGKFNFDDEDFQNYINTQYDFDNIDWNCLDIDMVDKELSKLKNENGEFSDTALLKAMTLIHRDLESRPIKFFYDVFDDDPLENKILDLLDRFSSGMSKMSRQRRAQDLDLAAARIHDEIEICCDRIKLLRTSVQIILDRMAELDSEEGYYQLGKLYMNGDFPVPQLRMKAIACYTIAAKKGHLNAMTELGKIYLKGQIVEKNTELGLKYLQCASDKYCVDAAVELAYYYISVGNTQVALNQLENLKKVSRENPTTEFIEGKIHYENNRKLKGMRLIISAAEKGCADAQYYLGKIYKNDSPQTNPDKQRMLKWFRSAAEQNHIQALYELGVLLSFDEIHFTDTNEPYYITADSLNGIGYLTEAAKQGLTDAQLKLGELYLDEFVPYNSAFFDDEDNSLDLVRSEEVESDFKLARYWIEQAALSGDVRAYIEQAYMIANGLGYEEDREYGIKQLKKYAHQGYEKAVQYLDFFKMLDQIK